MILERSEDMPTNTSPTFHNVIENLQTSMQRVHVSSNDITELDRLLKQREAICQCLVICRAAVEEVRCKVQALSEGAKALSEDVPVSRSAETERNGIEPGSA